ncbi:hypothetical protein [Solitalea canadensis]|uniref:Uncharacterized protein n=1 Tax=Solitalea canadensis (strain ATCC 29591 / DSM 3403 / JCM 21819 / LMG 8368 / NBRC 15130 / NCIMB 12057 / USAM 9D) TaxID=929556 RepID=H8KNA6_SOLCM|nr:hypothetical protein [Solitalea canadensis]AFD09439.1 hypothetical protein Solca_4449 [Solitalea canadensis DSM 3403]
MTTNGQRIYFTIRVSKQTGGSIYGYNLYYNSAITLSGYVDIYSWGGYGTVQNDYFYSDPGYPVYEIPIYDPFYEQVKASPGFNPAPGGSYPTI